MRIVLGIFLLLHGFAHLVGFAVPWRLTSNPEMPYKTTLLAGLWEVGYLGIRVNGVLWLVMALAVAFTGVGVLRQAAWWPAGLLYVSLASLALSILSWPDARIGVFINVALLLLLFLNARQHWLA